MNHVPASTQALREQLASESLPAERLVIMLKLAEGLWLSAPGEARPVLEQLVNEASAAGENRFLGRAASMLGELCRRAGDLDACIRYAEQVLAAGRAAGNRKAEVSGVNLLGTVHEERGEYAQAQECFERCLSLSREHGFVQGEQAALNQLAGLFAVRGQHEKALEYYRGCLALDKQTGDGSSRAVHFFNVGWTLVQMGDWEKAAENLYRSSALAEQHGFRDVYLGATNALAELLVKRNKLEQAIAMFSTVVEAERREQRCGGLFRNALADLGWAYFRSGNPAAAGRTWAEALEASERAGDRRSLAIVSVRVAELELAEGRVADAEASLARAAEPADELGLRQEQGEVLRVRALLKAEQDDAAGASELFKQAEAVLAGIGDTFELAQTRLQHARLLAEADRRDEAVPLLQSAARTFRFLSVVAESEETNRLLFQLETHTDRDAALLEALVGLAAIGLAPEKLIEQALELLAETWGFESGAVFVDGRAVALKGSPDLEAARAGRGAAGASGTSFLLPVHSGKKLLGTVYLERQGSHGFLASAGLLEVVARLLAQPMQRFRELPREAAAEIPGLQYRGVIGRNPAMLASLAMVAKVADTTIPVLVRGESGTGKELIARAIHESGARRSGPFVAVNCAAVPETLLEAEFFGVEKGAATGVAQRKGRFELADRGTIFLDEVGDMSPALQARLLRVLQEKSVERIGGGKSIAVDVRVIAATNMNLDELMQQGRFRSDLFYRLNAVELLLPPLRDRREDIPAFVRYFIARSNQEFGRSVLKAGDEVMTLFLAFPWPGNVRQLLHVVERGAILAEHQVIELCDLPADLREAHTLLFAPTATDPAGIRLSVRTRVAEAEKALVHECLQSAGGDAAKAAELSGYSRAHFYRLLHKHGIS